MNKNFKYYAIIWAILLAVYNVCVFVFRPIVPGFVINYDGRFWIAWSVVIITFIGHMFCAKIAFDAKNKEKFFLNISIITQSYTALVITAVTTSVLMLIPDCPVWISVIVSVILLGYSAITIICAKVAADVVAEIDDQIKRQTFFIKAMTDDASALIARAQSGTIKNECKKVYDAIRYSDPMSSDRLASVEGQIVIKFTEFSNSVKANNEEKITEIANEVVALVKERNNLCKFLK